MKIEIVKAADNNPVAEFFSSSSTPDTDANEAWPASKLYLGNDGVVPSDFARRLERERDEWAAMCGQYKQERDDARDEINIIRITLSKNGEAVGNGEIDFSIIEMIENLIQSKNYFVRKNDSLEGERDEARNQRDILRLDAQKEADHHDRMVGELEKVYAERDEWAAMCGQYKQERDKFAELSKQASQGINSTYQNIQYLLGALIAARNERDGAREMLQQYMFDRSGTWIDFLPADKPTP